MNSKTLVLLRTILLSTSGRNVLKYSKDKKRRGRAIAAYVGKMILYICLAVYAILMAVGYGMTGLANSIPAICILIITLLSFVFTLLKTNGYLFGFKEYDMLVSMPIEVKSIVACKFLYMYLVSLPWFACISFALLIGYGIYAQPALYVYLFWIMLTLVTPLLPTVIASLIGALVAKLGSGFRFKKAAQTLFMFVFVMFAMALSFSLQFIIEYADEKSSMKEVLSTSSNLFQRIEDYYPPMKWFDRAIAEGNVVCFFLFFAVSLLAFFVFYQLVARSYVRINSRLTSHVKRKTAGTLKFKKKSVANSIAFKEFKRLLGSVIYLTNASFGYVVIAIASVVVLFVDGEKVVQVVLKGAPIGVSVLHPTVPFFIYFMIGMVSTCCCTPSLEGKNFWILQSMPLSKAQIAKGKMLFNLYLNVPFGLLGVICFGICFKADLVYMLIYIVTILSLIAFSTTFGMLTGNKFRKLDWENEVEVIKQGAALLVYMFPNMFATMILMVGVVALSFIISGKIVLLISSFFYALLAIVCYLLVVKEKEA